MEKPIGFTGYKQDQYVDNRVTKPIGIAIYDDRTQTVKNIDNMVNNQALIDVSGMFSPGIVNQIGRAGLKSIGLGLSKIPKEQVFYHGTTRNVKGDFNPNALKYNRGGGKEGYSYFSPNAKKASSYAGEKTGSQVYPVNIDKSKLFDPTHKPHSDKMLAYLENIYGKDKAMRINTGMRDRQIGHLNSENEIVYDFLNKNNFNGQYVFEDQIKNIGIKGDGSVTSIFK